MDLFWKYKMDTLCWQVKILQEFYQLYLLISDEGVYVDSNGKVTKNVVLQWGELPTSVGKLYTVKPVLYIVSAVSGTHTLTPTDIGPSTQGRLHLPTRQVHWKKCSDREYKVDTPHINTKSKSS